MKIEADSSTSPWMQVVKYVLIIFAGVSIVLFYYQCVRNINKFHEIDLTSYIRASAWFFDGENPYQDVPRRYIYPLFLLFVVYPFKWMMSTPMAKGVTAAIWSAGLYASFFYAVATAWQWLYEHRTRLLALRQRLFLTAILIVMIHPLLQDEFLNGQVNLFVLAATVAFFVFTEKKQDFLAALFLAIAASIKIAPGVCLLYPLMQYRFKSTVYFVLLVAAMTVGLPLLFNDQSLEYYQYFISDVMPQITGSELDSGFRSFSIVSTVSHIFGIHWYPPVKITVVVLLTLVLVAPIFLLIRGNFSNWTRQARFVGFAAIISAIPLTFPMSEAHHLLLQVVPLTVIIYYIHSRVRQGMTLREWDGLVVLFVVSALGYHVGHALKDTPIRLLSLTGVYTGMLLLLARVKTQAALGDWMTEEDTQRRAD